MAEVPTYPDLIVRSVREKYLEKFIEAVRRDNQEDMYAYYVALDALTECFWCVRHMEAPK